MICCNTGCWYMGSKCTSFHAVLRLHLHWAVKKTKQQKGVELVFVTVRLIQCLKLCCCETLGQVRLTSVRSINNSTSEEVRRQKKKGGIIFDSPQQLLYCVRIEILQVFLSHYKNDLSLFFAGIRSRFQHQQSIRLKQNISWRWIFCRFFPRNTKITYMIHLH